MPGAIGGASRGFTARHPDLVFASVGSRSVHRLWSRGLRPRSFDLVLVDYAGSGERYRDDADLVLARPGTKLENFCWAHDAHLDGVEAWRQVLLLDDDIEIDADGIARLFAIMAERRLWLAGPAYLPGSQARWPIMLQDPTAELRYTNYVESGVTAFAIEALARLMPLMRGNRSGWGLDMIYSRVLGDPAERIAVIDATPCRHPYRSDPEMDQVMTRLEMQADGQGLLDTFLDGRMLEARVLGRVPLVGSPPVRHRRVGGLGSWLRRSVDRVDRVERP